MKNKTRQGLSANYSSGKMGIALAEACARRGAEVTLVCGPTPLGTTQAASGEST